MIPILELPPRLYGTEEEQINALREYLLRLVQQLNELSMSLNEGLDKEVRK